MVTSSADSVQKLTHERSRRSTDDLANTHFLGPFGGPGCRQIDVIQQGDQQDDDGQRREYPVKLPVALGAVTLMALCEMDVGQRLGMKFQTPAFPRIVVQAGLGKRRQPRQVLIEQRQVGFLAKQDVGIGKIVRQPAIV